MKTNLLALTAAAIALPLLLTSCSPSEPEPTETKTSEEDVIVREEQPEEVNAVENYEEFNSAIKDFVDLSAFSEDWLQIAPMVPMDDSSASDVWFAVIDAEKALEVSDTLIKDEGWSSAKDSAPQTIEEQEADVDKVIEEDPLSMSGVFYLEDGSSMSVSVMLDESTPQKTAQYMFSVNRVA